MTTRALDLRVLTGLTRYDDAHALQLELVEQRQASAIPDTLILLEHEPVITLGRNASDKGLLATPDELERSGVILRRIERGGQATYHGPGQLVGYPIVDLHERRLGVASYIRNLEQVMIRAASRFGIEAYRHDGLTGVFTDQGKLGAIGVRVTRGVTFHGFAFNVDPDLEHYRWIVPCGMTGMAVTSMRSIVGDTSDMVRARQSIIDAFCEVFGSAVRH